MESEKRYYSGTVKELLNDPYELRLHMAKMDREHKAEVAVIKKRELFLLKKIKQLKAENKDLENAAKQGYTII